MAKYQGKNVTVRALKRDDPQFGSKFDDQNEQVIIKHDDGREEVVGKDQVQN